MCRTCRLLLPGLCSRPLSGTDNEDSEFLLRKDLLADHVRAAGIGKNVSQKEKKPRATLKQKRKNNFSSFKAHLQPTLSRQPRSSAEPHR